MGCTLHSGLCKKCSVESKFGHGHSHGGHGHSHGNHDNSINGQVDSQSDPTCSFVERDNNSERDLHGNIHSHSNGDYGNSSVILSDSVLNGGNVSSQQTTDTDLMSRPSMNPACVGPEAGVAMERVMSSDTGYSETPPGGAPPPKSLGILERILGDPDANINVKAAMVHVLGDLIQSIGVLIATGVIYADVSICCIN